MFDPGKKVNSRKEIIKISKIWLRNVVKYGKYSLAKFANFVYVCITCGNVTIFEPIQTYTKFANFACKGTFCKIYIISQPNFAILLISLCSF